MNSRFYSIFALVFLAHSAFGDGEFKAAQYAENIELLNEYSLMKNYVLNADGSFSAPSNSKSTWSDLRAFGKGGSIAIPNKGAWGAKLEKLGDLGNQKSSRREYLRLVEVNLNGSVDQNQFRVTTFLPLAMQKASNLDSGKGRPMIETTPCSAGEMNGKPQVICGQTTSLSCQVMYNTVNHSGTKANASHFFSREDVTRAGLKGVISDPARVKPYESTEKHAACRAQILSVVKPTIGAASVLSSDCSRYIEGLGRIAFQLGKSMMDNESGADQYLDENLAALKLLADRVTKGAKGSNGENWQALNSKALFELGELINQVGTDITQDFARVNPNVGTKIFTGDQKNKLNALRLDVLASMVEDCFSLPIYLGQKPTMSGLAKSIGSRPPRSDANPQNPRSGGGSAP